MPGLTVAEKRHWKERISHRIDKRMEALCATEPNLMDRIQREARQRALGSSGLAEAQAELDAIQRQEEELNRRAENLHKSMLAIVRKVPAEEVKDSFYGCVHQEVTNALQRRQAVHEDELLAEHRTGKEILQLRREKDDLLDTVWLATSGIQVRELWKKVGELLGDEPTALQREALAIAPIPRSDGSGE
jgi:hypothetical protein